MGSGLAAAAARTTRLSPRAAPPATSLSNEPPRSQLSFAPSRIHARMAFLSQIDSFFLPWGMRISGEARQSRSHIKLLLSRAAALMAAEASMRATGFYHCCVDRKPAS